jgi:hypothetical protein
VLLRWFEDTVSAITYSIIRAHRGPAYSPLHNEVVRFVIAQHGRTPDWLRVPLTLATCAFDLSAIPLTGRRFSRLPPEGRRRPIELWSGAPLGALRDVIRFYETLVVFGWTAMRAESGGSERA